MTGIVLGLTVNRKWPALPLLVTGFRGVRSATVLKASRSSAGKAKALADSDVA